MPVIKVDNQQYALRPGPNRLGAGADVDVRVDGDSALGVLAIVELGVNAQAVIRRAGQAAAVRVNGIALVDPTPLIHGDKVEIAGKELLFADDNKAGNTAFVSAADIASIVQKRAGPARATTATGGRLVSLVDGKEYSVPASGVTLGRDASADVVVAQNEVSRKHAEIVPVESGYEVRDFSANGVFVNGTRIDKAQVLSRSDVIRIGTEEFRFYADVRPTGPSAPAAPPFAPPFAPPAMAPLAMAPPAMAPPPAMASAPAPLAMSPAPPAPAAPRMPPAVPAAPRDDRPVLATLEVTNSGLMKGQTFEIHVPLAHVGRGSHNDIVIRDDSVSETHAKLQRRDDGWYVVDAESTNGTYVGGQRLTGERRLEGAPDVRFGGVKMMFRAVDVPADVTAGTRAIASLDRAKLRPTAQKARVPTPESAPPVAPAPVSEPPQQQGLPTWVWIAGAVVILGVVALIALIR
ncbi:MAG: FHA domain-containing protein [Gemmatimonadaceae bacterium]